MNIVKVKDITLDNLSEGVDKDIFESFKDKYCYCINWQWIVLFDDINAAEYVEYSETNADMSEILGERAVRYEFYLSNGLIDIAATEKANRITQFVEANKFSSDSDITLYEIKRFRTWLAEVLYNLLSDVEEYDIVEMLNYYKLEMNDDTISHLTHFSPKATVDVINPTVKNTCGCSNKNTISLGAVTVCDPILQYRKAVYEKMVSTFSDISFWTERETEFLVEVKKYIDAIIHHNLPLVSSEYVSDLYDCGCLSNADSNQERLMSMLKNLSIAFGYMVEEKTTGNKNFIGDALNNWAVYLYEKMRWY